MSEEMLSRFYVYKLIDPRDSAVFYVGKGQNKRAWAHEYMIKSGRRSSNEPKTARIKEILDCKMNVIVEITSRHSDEMEAYEEEAKLIATIGIANLTNRNSGGFGSYSDGRRVYVIRDIRVALDSLKLLISMGTQSEWIALRNYSQEVGELWYRRLTGLLEKIILKVVDLHGADKVKEYAKRFA